MFYKKTTFLTAMALWREKAEVCGFSPKTVRNTETTMKMLAKFMSPTTDLRHFSAAEYGRVLKRIKMSGYTAETVCDLNATLRKFVNLAFKKRLIRRNVLVETDNLRIASQSRAQVIPREHFLKIIARTQRREYRFLLTLLYYTGMRIGEALALTREDFLNLGGVTKVRVDKSYLYEFKMVKTTKNDFRHTFVSNLIRGRVPLPVVAQVSGDTQTTLLRRYSHVFPNDDRLILEAVSCASGNAAKPT